MAELLGSPGIVSQEYLEALVRPHEIVVEADVYRQNRRVASLDVLGGSIICSQRSVVRRTLSLSVGGELPVGEWDSMSSTPTTAEHPLSHFLGHEIRVRHGLRYPGGTVEWVPVGRFRIEGHSGGDLLGFDALSLTGLSFESYVEEARFTKPRSIQSSSAVSAIVDLVREVLPHAAFRVSVLEDRRVPRTMFDRDRWDAIETIASGIGAVVYTDGAGIWNIAPAATAQSTPVWTLAPGLDGSLVSATSNGSRESVYNEAVVTNDNATTDVRPVFATARDTNPLSPTLWGDPEEGAFGKVTTFLEIPTLTTQSQADDAAAALLARSIGAAESFSVQSIPIAPMEAGDVVDVVTGAEGRGKRFRHIVDEYTLPLDAGGSFTLATRNIGEV